MMFEIARIEIARDPAAVFAYTTDPAKTPTWVGFIEDERTNEWPARVGTVYTNRRTDGSTKMFRVAVWEPAQRFRMDATDNSFSVEYTFEALGVDKCLLHISLSTELDDMATTTMQSELEHLKSILETAD